MENIAWGTSNKLSVFPLGDFAEKMARVIPSLVDLLHSAELRSHERWGELIPYNVRSYGSGRSLGHAIRADVLVTEKGEVKVCELEFVPAGRAHTLLAIPDERRQLAFLETFARWYRSLSRGPIVYATATRDAYTREVALFSASMRERAGIPISPGNIDDGVDAEGTVIDRLFYRAEMVDPLREMRGEVVTKEPFLDSKMVFALVHDSFMDTVLKGALGEENLAFLRRVLPETYPLQSVYINQFLFQEIVANRWDWVIKNTDVETSSSWGARGVIMGRKYHQKVWEKTLRGAPLAKKDMGYHPIIQRFHLSADFRFLWDAVVEGSISQAKASEFGYREAPTIGVPAVTHVYARFGVYFLVNTSTKEVFAPNICPVTLRQDALAHGASDALNTACEIA